MKQFPYCLASFGLVIRQRGFRSWSSRTSLHALTHKQSPVTILQRMKNRRIWFSLDKSHSSLFLFHWLLFSEWPWAQMTGKGEHLWNGMKVEIKSEIKKKKRYKRNLLRKQFSLATEQLANELITTYKNSNFNKIFIFLIYLKFPNSHLFVLLFKQSKHRQKMSS